MIRIFFLILLSNLLLSTYKTAEACAGEPDYSNFSLYLNPYTYQDIDSTKYPYIYTVHEYYYNQYGSRTQMTETELNVAEWAKALGTDKLYIEKFVYDNNLDELKSLLENKKKNKELSELSLGKYADILSKLYQNEAYIEYFIAIQDYTYNVRSAGDEWVYTYHAGKADPRKMKENLALSKSIYKKLKKDKSPLSKIFKTRIAYHLVRAPFFNEEYKLADEHYNTYAKNEIAPIESSVIQEWLQGLKGGIDSRLNRPYEAVLHFARKFNRGRVSNYQAYIDLRWLQDDVVMEDVLAIAKTAQDSIDIYAALAATTIELRSEFFNKNVASISSEKTAFYVWYREMRKVEEIYYHPKMCTYGPDRYDDYNESLEKHPLAIKKNYEAFKKLTLKLYAQAQNKEYKENYANALAYIRLMDNDIAGAQQYLDYTFTNGSRRNQNLILQVYKETISTNTLNTESVCKILDIKYDEKNAYEYLDVVHYFIRDHIAPHYLYKQGDSLGAFTLWSQISSYQDVVVLGGYSIAADFINYTMETPQYLAMIAEMKTGNHPLLKWYKSKGVNIVSDDDLLFQKYVRDENWQEAKNTLNLENKKLTKDYYSPFVMHYDGYYSPYSVDSSRAMMTIAEYLDLGIKLKNKIATSGTGQDYLNYGMYHFSNTFYGHNSISDNDRLHYQHFQVRPSTYFKQTFETDNYYHNVFKRYPFETTKSGGDYYYCYTAEKYLQKAYELLTNEETKAMSCFLLARCYQTRCPLPEFTKSKYGYESEKTTMYKGEEYSKRELWELKNPYLGEMKENYSHTNTYKEAFSKCSNLRNYLE